MGFNGNMLYYVFVQNISVTPGHLVADSVAIGRRMRDRRDYLRLTQQEVANVLNVNRVTYQQWESGRNEMAVTDLPRIAKALGTTSTYLLGEEDDEVVQDREAAMYLNNMPPMLKPAARAALKALYDQRDREQTTHGQKAEDA